MKFNKKLIVPFLSTVTGLSIAGGLGGAFAWYQYNTQVTASFVGTSVADSSVLQIGHYETENNQQVMKWGKDFYPYASGQKQKLVPVTFGQLVTVGTKADCLNSTYAYGYPEAGVSGAVVNSGYDSWTKVQPNAGFVRFDMYLRALNADGTQAALKVYLSDVLIECPAEDNGSKDITKAVRVHLDVKEGGSNRLIAKNEVEDLDLYGPLDLDGIGGNDTTGGYVDSNGDWVTGELVTYGRDGETQDAIGTTGENGESTIVATRGADGKYGLDQADKVICTTKASGFIQITVTAWIEGWACLKTNEQGATSPIWNPAYSAGTDIRFGMTFDTGVVRVG